jgi:hypothetical protein
MYIDIMSVAGTRGIPNDGLHWAKQLKLDMKATNFTKPWKVAVPLKKKLRLDALSLLKPKVILTQKQYDKLDNEIDDLKIKMMPIVGPMNYIKNSFFYARTDDELKDLKSKYKDLNLKRTQRIKEISTLKNQLVNSKIVNTPSKPVKVKKAVKVVKPDKKKKKALSIEDDDPDGTLAYIEDLKNEIIALEYKKATTFNNEKLIKSYIKDIEFLEKEIEENM